MTANYQQFNIRLNTISPLHIGSGNELTSTGEYLKTTSHVYFLRHYDLMERLKTEGLFDEYVQRILEHEKGFDFFQTLKAWNIDPLKLAARSIRLHQQGLNPASNNQLQLHIKTKGQAYVPGSSIKGLLRTAILFKYLKEHPNELRSIETEIGRCLDGLKPLYTIRKYWEKKERELLPETVFQCIRPYDTDCVDDESLVVEQVNRQNLSPATSEESKGLDWLVECIASEVTLPFELSILHGFDQAEFQYLKSATLKPLLNCINAHSQILIGQERQLVAATSPDPAIKAAILQQLSHYEELIATANGEYAIARLGKGKTLFFQTILPLLKVELQTEIISLFDQDPSSFPRSRVLTVQDKLMMGWVKLEVNKPELKLPDNHLEGQIQVGALLNAIVVAPKKVGFLINNTPFTDVSLVLMFKHQEFAEGDKVKVLVHQMSNDGRIVQVKINQQ